MSSKAKILGGDFAGDTILSKSYAFQFVKGLKTYDVNEETLESYNTTPDASGNYVIDIHFKDGKTAKIQLDQKNLDYFMAATKRKPASVKKRKTTNIIIIVAGIIIIAVALMAAMGGDDKSSKSTLAAASSQAASQTEKKSKDVSNHDYLYNAQNALQAVYKTAAEKNGVGVPTVDVSFMSYKEWKSMDGLFETTGTFTLSSEKGLTHSFHIRWGEGSKDVILMDVDGQRIFFNEELQDQYTEKFAKSQNNQ